MSLEWKTVELKSIANVTMGQSPKSEFYNDNFEGMPFLQGNKTFGDKYPSFELYTTSIKKVAEKNSVLMSVRAPVGDLNIAQEDICIGRGVCGLQMKKGDNEFLYYLLKANISHLINKESGTVFGSINKNDIETFEVTLPEDSEDQQKILTILKNIDKKIEVCKDLNKNLYGILLNCFNEIFDHEEKNCKLSDIVNIRRGASPRPIKDYISDAGINWLKISDVTWTEMPFIYKIKEKIIEKGKSKSVFIEKGTLVVSNSATPGIPKFIMVDTCVHDGWLVLNKYGDNLRYYLYFLIVKIRRELINLAYGSVFNNLKTDTLKNYEISKPTDDQLDKFNKMAYPIMEKIDSNTKEIMMLSKLRDTLLPKLMSGEIDVSKINCDL